MFTLIYLQLSFYNIIGIMFRKTKAKLELIDPLNFQEGTCQFGDDAFNPEDDARNRLIDISSEEINENNFEIQNNVEYKVKKQNESYKPKETKILMSKYEKNRVSVVENFTQSHRIWRKKSARMLEGDLSPIQRQQYSKNQSSFIIFQNGYLNNFSSCVHGHLAFEEGLNKTQKTRHPRNIMLLIKRKNIANLKDQVHSQKQALTEEISSSRIKYKRNMSPTVRVTQSCEFKKDFESISPIKITTNDASTSQQSMLELKCTNPNFRNKKVSNYIKMRASAVTKKSQQG